MEAGKVEIKKIVLQVGAANIALTVDEARKLHDALTQLLGTERTVAPVYVPYPIPSVWPYWRIWTTSGDDNTGAAVSYTVS